MSQDLGRERGGAIPPDDDERFAELIGRELTRDADHPVWRDDRFLEWLAGEARALARRAPDSPDRLSDAAFRARGEAIMARAYARLLRVEARAGRPAVEARRSDAEGETGGRSIPVIELGIAAGVGRELWDEPAEAWLELPPEAPAGEYLALKIVGESMAPLMHTGDTVLVRLGPELARDTAVVARVPDNGYVCKRVAQIGADAVELASLEPGRPSVRIPRDPRLILGTVMLVWCHHRHRHHRRALTAGQGSSRNGP